MASASELLNDNNYGASPRWGSFLLDNPRSPFYDPKPNVPVESFLRNLEGEIQPHLLKTHGSPFKLTGFLYKAMRFNDATLRLLYPTFMSQAKLSVNGRKKYLYGAVFGDDYSGFANLVGKNIEPPSIIWPGIDLDGKIVDVSTWQRLDIPFSSGNIGHYSDKFSLNGESSLAFVECLPLPGVDVPRVMAQRFNEIRMDDLSIPEDYHATLLSAAFDNARKEPTAFRDYIMSSNRIY